MQSSATTRELVRRRQRDGGYLLIAILFTLALIVVGMAVEAPNLVQQIKRDREDEMIHRGTEYARAIKKFYKKFGRYPANLDQLDNTNQVRFLRKHYKDPLTKDGKWKLLNYADVQGVLLNRGGIPGGLPGSQGSGQNPGSAGAAYGGISLTGNSAGTQTVNTNGVFSSPSGQQAGTAGVNAVSQQANSGDASQTTQGQGNNPFTNTFGAGQNATNQATNSGTADNSNQGTGSATGGANPAGAANSPFGQGNSANQVFGGGAIVGVASVDKDPTIRIYNKKKTYNEWMFIYDPTQDRKNVLLRGPYQPMLLGGAQGQGINGSVPADQLNGQQSPFGQQNNNNLGQGNSGFAQPGNGGMNSPQPIQPQQQPQ